jgi:hypothetical protein
MFHVKRGPGNRRLSAGEAPPPTLASAGFGAPEERAEGPPMVELTSVKQRRMTT